MIQFRKSSSTVSCRNKRQEHSRYEAAEVLAYIEKVRNGNLTFSGTFGPIRIAIKDKYQVLALSPKCVFCDIEIGIVCVERIENNQPWYLHFYGVKDNKLVLFTVDHIVPRSLGGKDIVANYQTCCEDCNKRKGNVCTDPFAAARIRLRGSYEPPVTPD